MLAGTHGDALEVEQGGQVVGVGAIDHERNDRRLSRRSAEDAQTFDRGQGFAGMREQFGQRIGRFQGVSFKLADMTVELKAAELMTLEAAWKVDQGTATDADIAAAKLKATEMLAMVADEAIQVHGGMGLMDELPLERIWRDARIERIWDGTSEIQRHIISRSLLRPLGA